ncbi:unnamed protein product [Lathyrus sativus]|nr:unnamed protein product [Lathyrus sativus]
MSEKKPVVGLSWQPQLPFPYDPSHAQFPAAKGQNNTIWKPNSELVGGLLVPPNDPRKLNKLLRQQVKDTSEKGWFGMPAQTMTPELQRNLKLQKLRGAIDPKRHYKKCDSNSKTLPKYFQIGTVVGSPLDYFSGRLTKKERKETFADELLADKKDSAYRKRKVLEIEEQRQPAGNAKWKIRGQSSLKRAKERRKF